MTLKSKLSKRALDLSVGVVSLLLASWPRGFISRVGIRFGGFATDLGLGSVWYVPTHSLFNDGRLTLCPGGTHPGWHSHRRKYSLTCTMKLIVYICVMIYVSPDRKGCVLSITHWSLSSPAKHSTRPPLIEGPHFSGFQCSGSPLRESWALFRTPTVGTRVLSTSIGV